MPTKENMQDFVINLLKEKIPPAYTYHNYEHTLYVQHKATEIAIHEQLGEYELRLLHTAALWHDTGYVQTYKGHEAASCDLAKQYLPQFGYNNDDIERICGMIMATKIPQTPQNLAEAILADADLAYLGTITASEKSDDLYRELLSVNPGFTRAEWNRQQLSFLESHEYFTKFYREKRAPVKQAYLEQVKQLVAAQ